MQIMCISMCLVFAIAAATLLLHRMYKITPWLIQIVFRIFQVHMYSVIFKTAIYIEETWWKVDF